MSKNIRIIKRSQRDAKSKAASNRVPDNKTPRHTARDITGHVAGWIEEFHQLHTPDPRRAFANLFAEPMPSAAD
jgi:hypothetical protein